MTLRLPPGGVADAAQRQVQRESRAKDSLKDSATTSLTSRVIAAQASYVNSWARMALYQRGRGDAGQLGQHQLQVRGVVSSEIRSIIEPAL